MPYIKCLILIIVAHLLTGCITKLSYSDEPGRPIDNQYLGEWGGDNGGSNGDYYLDISRVSDTVYGIKFQLDSLFVESSVTITIEGKANVYRYKNVNFFQLTVEDTGFIDSDEFYKENRKEYPEEIAFREAFEGSNLFFTLDTKDGNALSLRLLINSDSEDLDEKFKYLSETEARQALKDHIHQIIDNESAKSRPPIELMRKPSSETS
ncbi:hypothetical protein [Gilvimarinus chinensis]|uniref:hypothetical protein n=1 Tax=Gilvimarinus chinensis TaxID=396005 RepID=UPI0003794704|nr:hypothetical protein [Gilvimarinus chinensis]